MSDTLAENLSKVQQKIKQCAETAGRDLNEVCLIAVSKTRSLDEVKTIASLGQQVVVANLVKRLIMRRLTLLTSNAIKTYYMSLAANGFHSDSLAGGKKSGEMI